MRSPGVLVAPILDCPTALWQCLQEAPTDSLQKEKKSKTKGARPEIALTVEPAVVGRCGASLQCRVGAANVEGTALHRVHCSLRPAHCASTTEPSIGKCYSKGPLRATVPGLSSAASAFSLRVLASLFCCCSTIDDSTSTSLCFQ